MFDIFIPVFIVTVIALALTVGLLIYLDKDANHLDR